MSIIYNNETSTIWLLCDKCKKQQDAGETQSNLRFTVKKNELGWRSIRSNNMWQDICPECLSERGGK